MDNTTPIILEVALHTPLRQSFEYLPMDNVDPDNIPVGSRVEVPFGKRKMVGVVIRKSNKSHFPIEKLKKIEKVLDYEPLFNESMLSFFEFASNYYHHSLGEIILGSLPALLKEGGKAELFQESVFRLTEQGFNANLQQLKYATHQLKILQLLRENPSGLTRSEITKHDIPSNALTALLAKGYVNKYAVDAGQSHPLNASTLDLNTHQQLALKEITDNTGFQTFLLEGITGSGKTEVYLRAIDSVLGRNKQALVLVPEIGLTPQTVTRFQERFSVPVAVLHSGLTEKERMQAWLSAQRGISKIIIGTRSAILAPFADLGIIILDEEHDLSFKQQSGFRYSAKDLAIVRAKMESIPVILGSATPSLETLYNAKQKKYTHLYLPERAGNAVEPKFHILDIRNKKLDYGLSPVLVTQMKQHLDQNGQILLFINRRGYAPTLLCHQCGWTACCKRCDARFTYHHHMEQLLCHHCGTSEKMIAHCQSCSSQDILLLGLGTERIEHLLQTHFPDVPMVRLDRDSTKRKGSMEKLLKSIHNGNSRILIGTQMLAKGHHFPDVTMVAILDVDSSLYSADFRAPERLGQVIVQVAGRAGRAEKPGEVYIQTHNPQHPLLLQLVTKGYGQFAKELLKERKSAALPPYSFMALFRAEATQVTAPQQFLSEVRDLLASAEPQIQVFGPIPAIMEKKAGKFRAQLMLQAKQRIHLQKFLPPLLQQIESLPSKKMVRWSLDIDPLELF